MADEDNQQDPQDPAEETPQAAPDEQAGEPTAGEEQVAEETAEEVLAETVVEELVEEVIEEVVEEEVIEEAVAQEVAEEIAAVAEEAPSADSQPSEDHAEAEEEEPAPRVKPSVPGAHLEVDIVPEGVDPLGREGPEDPYAIEDEDEPVDEEQDGDAQEDLHEPIASAAIDLTAGARYTATGKRKTAIARVILRPGTGTYQINGRTLEEHFPRQALQRNIRQPLETVGYQEKMDVIARLHGGGISAHAGALRHGISRALLEADPNLRGELKRRGFLTRDSRAKERKKAGLKKARKRPQFSKR
jgi:small subunit ribosomal protein S9